MAKTTTNQTRFRRGMNPNSLKNLHPFEKGNHASPGPKKKADCLLACIKEELGKVSLNGQTNEQLIASVLVATAARGNIKAVELMLSYLHSKPTFVVGSDPDKPLPTPTFFFLTPDGAKIGAQEKASEAK